MWSTAFDTGLSAVVTLIATSCSDDWPMSKLLDEQIDSPLSLLLNYGCTRVYALANEDTFYIVADTLLLEVFLGLRKLGNICCGHKMFLEQNQKHFLCHGHKICFRNKCCARGQMGLNICVGNNVSATMCPRLPGPYVLVHYSGVLFVQLWNYTKKLFAQA